MITKLIYDHVQLHSTREPYVLCTKCGASCPVSLRLYGKAETIDGLAGFIQNHEHPAPKPLTHQREQIRIANIHRQGALRCGYGAARW